MSNEQIELRYGEQIAKMLDVIAIQNDIDEADKPEFFAMTLTSLGMSLASLDQAISIGVSNGVSADAQMLMVTEMLAQTSPA